MGSEQVRRSDRDGRGGPRGTPGAGAPLKVGANVAMAVCVRAAHWRVRAGVAKPITALAPLSGEVAASSRRHVRGGRTRERNTRLGGKSLAWAARVVGSRPTRRRAKAAQHSVDATSAIKPHMGDLPSVPNRCLTSPARPAYKRAS